MREAYISRKTNETEISVNFNLDGNKDIKVDTGVGFFDHMLELFAFHGGFDLMISAKGDLDVDDHHTIEDVGIALGCAFKEALGDKRGIARYGTFMCPMDESLSTVNIDISGRPYLVFHCEFQKEMLGMMSSEMVKEFFYAFAMNAGVTLHINLNYGENDHHKCESIFKAFGHALKEAVTIESDELPSTKGFLQ